MLEESAQTFELDELIYHTPDDVKDLLSQFDIDFSNPQGFLDVFRAVEENKPFIVNDIDARLPKLFLECAYGKHTVENHSEWVSREEFHAKKETDAYIALVWSFGNNGIDYIYGADIEEMKHAYHKAVYFGDLNALEPFGYKLTASARKSVYGRYLDYQRQIKAQAPTALLEVVTRQTEIERLQRLQRLQSLQSLQVYGTDYRKVPFPKNALLYCDIPYIGTNCGKYGGFNHSEFYEWADEQSNIFVSEYTMPDAFIPVARIEKVQLSAANGNSVKAMETIYTNRKTYDSLSDDFKAVIATNTAEQITLTDYLEEVFKDGQI